MSILLITSLGIASNALTQRSATITSTKSNLAFQNADRGVELFLQEIYHDTAPVNDLESIVASNATLTCDSGRIRSTDGFEVITYERVLDGPSVEATDCDVQMGDVARFRIIGEGGSAARALEVTVQNSVNRGLIAHWQFEDSAISEEDFGVPGSPTAGDISVNNHILTLCPIDDNRINQSGFPSTFDRCPQTDEDTKIDPEQDHEAIWFNHNTQWTDTGDGAIDENVQGRTHHSQGIEFNGVSNYLTLNTENVGSNYVDPDDVKLQPEDALAISAWIKKEKDHVGGVVVANGSTYNRPNSLGGDTGYALFFVGDNQIRGRIQGSGADVQTTATYTDDGSWQHVVLIWDKDAQSKPRLYINGRQRNQGGERSAAMNYASVDHLSIGGVYRGDDIDKFIIDDFGTYDGDGHNDPKDGAFKGALDDIRIYDRALTDLEIKSLCLQAQTSVRSQCDR